MILTNIGYDIGAAFVNVDGFNIKNTAEYAVILSRVFYHM